MENAKKVTYNELKENGIYLGDNLHYNNLLKKRDIDISAHLYELNGIEYVVLSDNSVITRIEDNECDPFFPY